MERVAPHTRDDGWLCEPGSRCADHVDADPGWVDAYGKGYIDGWDDRGKQDDRADE